MSLRGCYDSLNFRLFLLIILTVGATCFALAGEWWLLAGCLPCWAGAIKLICKLFKRNAQKVSFMFDAIENADQAFRYAESGSSSSDGMVNRSLNRIIRILFQARADAIQKEKYHELILNSVNTGIIVMDENGYVHQSNNEALRLLGLSVFTHLKQLRQLGEGLEEFFSRIRPGNRHQVSFSNERGAVQLSVRVSEMALRDKYVRILAINDIKNELDNKEIDSWIRLTRVLTHEIMNAVTPITSLSDTLLLSIHGNTEIRSGLETISSTGKSLISFVKSYRDFTHIPMPRPSLFYVRKFADRMVQLARHQDEYSRIAFLVDIRPEGLIVYADENLAGQVILNLLKNAMQAIAAAGQADGRIEIRAFCGENEAVVIEVSNNGPSIPPEEAEHIFVPFFTTKEGGSGVGLSISRQIMRLSGGSIILKNTPATKETTFVLTFP